MKTIAIYFYIAFLVVLSVDFHAQTNADVSEQRIRIFLSDPSLHDTLRSEFNVTPMQFKIQQRAFLREWSDEIVSGYDAQNFDLDTIEEYFWTKLNRNIDALGLHPTSLDRPHLPPVVNTRAPNGPCVNMDFETGDLTGWEMFEGEVNTNPAEIVNTNQIFTPGVQHMVMGAGTDPLVPISTVNPNGGASSLRLGDGDGSGGLAASVRQTFLVTNANAVFTYSYAVVLEDPSGHTAGEKPFFKVNIYDENGASIPCGEYEVVAGSGLGGNWVSYGAGFYKDWETVFAPLDGYIGQNVTIEFISGDCSQSGHYGYAYVDASCSALELIEPGVLICDGNPVILEAPAGAQSYAWSTGATTQSISTATPGTYNVDVTPVQGSACAVTLSATVSGSTGAPTANYTAIPTDVCVGESVSFTDNSSASNGAVVDYWDWNFNDGSQNSSLPNPSHSFSTSGSYDVEFVAGVLVPGQGGCYDTIVQTINVGDGPTADFESSFECEGTVTNFSDLSSIPAGTISNWRWDFNNDGIVDNITQNPNFGYLSAGTYQAELYVDDGNGCADSVVLPVVINPVPTAHFNHNDVCENEIITFNDSSYISTGSILAWQWDFGDALGTSLNQNETYLYNGPGTYNVTLSVTSDSGCISNTVIPVSMFVDPIADFDLNSACEGEFINFSDNTNFGGATPSIYEFDFQNDGIVDYQGPSTAFQYAASGVYQVHLYVENSSGCSDDTTKTVYVNPIPIADFSWNNACEDSLVSFNNTSILAQGNIIDYEWNLGNGNISNIQDPSDYYSSEGIIPVQLEVTSDSGCTNSITHFIEIYPTPEVLFFTSDVCDGTQADFNNFSQVSNQFTPNNIVDWQWEILDVPVVNLSGTSVSHLFSGPGSFPVSLTVTTNNNCVSSSVQNVNIHPNPVVNFTSPNPEGCATWCADFNSTTSISSGSISQYLWDFGNGLVSTDPNPSSCFENNGLVDEYFDISLMVTSDQGCTDQLTENSFVTVFPNPIADFEFDPQTPNVYFPTVEFNNTSSLADINYWNFADLGNSSDYSPSFSFPDADAGTYEVCLNVSSFNGCVDDTCKIVTVESFGNLYVPNVFTPDGDGVNDFFGPELFGYSEEGYIFRIFDRWGLLLYETTNVLDRWDGVYQASPVQQDVYVWQVQATDKYTDEVVKMTGHVTVLR